MNDKQTGSLVMMLFQEDEAKGIIPDPGVHMEVIEEKEEESAELP